MFVAVARASDKVIVASYLPRKGDVNQPQYFSTVEEVLSAPEFASKVVTGSRYRLVGASNAFNFVVDSQQRIHIAITSSEYPERLVFAMLNELSTRFASEFDEKARSCREGGLNGKAKNLLASLSTEYEDPSKKDKIAAVQSKVEDVKLTMQSNIDGMLKNLDKTEHIQQDSEQLVNQAALFDNQAGKLKNREKWKSRKLTIIIAIIVAIILAVLIATLVKS